jgi:GT2 family glycosyltransferase/glycosyltransferase involved in cell wall biosynthesis
MTVNTGTVVENQIAESSEIGEPIPVVDIIITVRTRLSILQPCIESLLRHAPNSAILTQRILFVDDGSPPDTIVYENAMCEQYPDTIFCLSTNLSLRGYTLAVVLGTNYGARQKQVSKAIVLLNSDTIVTENWLINLFLALMNNPNDKVKIVGPVSNAASYQSVPETKAWNAKKEKYGDWSINPMPVGMSVDLLAKEVRRIASLPGIVKESEIMILNGFCFMFKRDLIDSIGPFDGIRFPEGYGEEVDFSIRAQKGGFEGRIIPSSYVSHLKSSSFKPASKITLKNTSREALVQLYGAQFLADFDAKSQNQTDLVPFRFKVQEYYDSISTKYANMNLPGSILFALHDVGFAGGVISILTEAYQMRLYGVNASISMPDSAAGGKPLDIVRAIIPGITDEMLYKLIILHPGANMEPDPTSPEFIAIAKTFDIVVATYCKTMKGVEAAIKKNPSALLGYYAQDYEPWFWYSPFELDKNPKGRSFTVAKNSYNANKKNVFVIAKTFWTAHMIKNNHNVGVNLVQGSMNHNIYSADKTSLALKMAKKFDPASNSNKFRIVAMVRPSTPRRNPKKTLDMLMRLAHAYPDTVEITICGCTEDVLLPVLEALVKEEGPAPHRSIKVLGGSAVTLASVVKDRNDMANMFRAADIFIDLSWWQAYGRSGLEAMACGCVAVMPSVGASKEICEDGKYCLAHSGDDIEGYFKVVTDILTNDKLRYALILNGMERTWLYSVEGAAASMATQLKSGLRHHRKSLKTISAEPKKTSQGKSKTDKDKTVKKKVLRVE